MKTVLRCSNLFATLLFLAFTYSCVDSKGIDVPEEENQQTTGNSSTTDNSGQTNMDPENGGGTQTNPNPNPEPVFELVSKPVREIKYSGCNIRCQIKTDANYLVSIPQECDWITLYDGYNDSSHPGVFGLTISPLPETVDHCEEFIFDFCCSHEDREATIVISDATHTRTIEILIKQLCFGCSQGWTQESDQVIEF